MECSATLADLERGHGGLIRARGSQGNHGQDGGGGALAVPTGPADRRLVVAGLGDRSTFGQAQAIRAAGAAAKQLAAGNATRVVFCFDDDWDDGTVSAAICGVVAGCHGQDLYRSERKLHVFRELLWSGRHQQAVAEGVVLGEGVNLTRRLVNEPPMR